jgi:Mn-containing catalase
LYATYDGAKGDPASAALGTEKGVMGKIKDALDPDEK